MGNKYSHVFPKFCRKGTYSPESRGQPQAILLLIHADMKEPFGNNFFGQKWSQSIWISHGNEQACKMQKNNGIRAQRRKYYRFKTSRARFTVGLCCFMLFQWCKAAVNPTQLAWSHYIYLLEKGVNDFSAPNLGLQLQSTLQRVDYRSHHLWYFGKDFCAPLTRLCPFFSCKQCRGFVGKELACLPVLLSRLQRIEENWQIIFRNSNQKWTTRGL